MCELNFESKNTNEICMLSSKGMKYELQNNVPIFCVLKQMLFGNDCEQVVFE